MARAWADIPHVTHQDVADVTDLDRMRPVLERWLSGDDLWLRRTVIICQLKSKGDTDVALLFDACERTAHESDFFIRKAIGWALRQYARTDPDWVPIMKRAAAIVTDHGGRTSHAAIVSRELGLP